MNHSNIQFIVASSGSAGDTFPFLNIAKHLQQRGRTITFAGPIVHKKYADLANVPFKGFGSDEQYFAALNDPNLWSARKGIATVWKYTNESLTIFPEYIHSFSKDQPLILLVHPLLLPAAAIAKSIRPDIKIIAMYLAPANLRTYFDPLTIGPLNIPSWIPLSIRKWIWKQVDTQFIDPALLPYLNEVRQQHKLQPVENFIDHMQSIADSSIALFPTWFSKQQPDWPTPMYSANFQLYDPNKEQGFSSELIEFMTKGEAPIIFTPGTANRQATNYFKYALNATQRLGHRAIFLTLFPEQLPEKLPESILWQSYLPLNHLLPFAAAIVHHGGIGTTAEALRAGTPQLIVPMAHDQFDNAYRIKSFGVGNLIFSSRLNTSKLYKSLKNLLESKSVPMTCKKLASYFPKNEEDRALYDFIEK